MTRKATKKVILFVVEGPSEETAFGSIFEKIFDKSLVKFDVVHGDLTCSTTAGTSRPRERVRDKVLEHLSYDRGYRWTDLERIVQICDTDGAFVSDDLVMLDESVHIAYEPDCIRTDNPESICKRNREKQAAMKQLASIGELTYKKHVVALSVYYLSRNMEHVLHGKNDDLTNSEKEALAHSFRRRYARDIDGFGAFMSNPTIAARGNYSETWKYIEEGANSLSRVSNLHLLLPEHLSGLGGE